MRDGWRSISATCALIQWLGALRILAFGRAQEQLILVTQGQGKFIMWVMPVEANLLRHALRNPTLFVALTLAIRLPLPRFVQLLFAGRRAVGQLPLLQKLFQENHGRVLGVVNRVEH